MNRRGVPELVCVLFVLLLRAPFLNHAIQGDDVYYLAGAEYAQIDPLHPHHARYAFLGVTVDMRGHPHPPLNTWILAGLLAATGDIDERTYHAAYVAFSIIAALAMLSLARRFSPHPVLATLLFLAAPAFVVNGTSLEADLPFLAFWMAAIALFVRAVDAKSLRLLGGSAAAMALASLTAFQSVALLPVLAAYLLIRRSRWAAAWGVLAAPVAVLFGWQIFERLAGGVLPATVLTGYFQTYGLQKLAAKLQNAAALTVHLGWLVFPLLAVTAFVRAQGKAVIGIAASALALALVDPNPLFWLSWGVGALVIVSCVSAALKSKDEDERFLGAWVSVFFAAALVVFFAGSARYLMPAAAPVALLTAQRLAKRKGILAGGLTAGLIVSLGLAAANYQHWNGYRRFIADLRTEIAQRRAWIDGEWGFRYYAEAEGAAPLLRSTELRPGDLVLTSELGRFEGAGSGPRKVLKQAAITSNLPFRLIGIGARSGYSTAAMGLRPFDVSAAPIDRVRAEIVAERQPTLSYLQMNSPEAEYDIVSGLGNLESGTWRWTTSRRAVVMLKSPEHPAALEALFYIPDNAPARHFELLAEGRVVAARTFGGPGEYTLRSEPFAPQSRFISVELLVDHTFRAPGDERDLGVVLKGIGFR